MSKKTPPDTSKLAFDDTLMVGADEIETLASLKRSLDLDCRELISREIDALDKISQFSQTVEQRLKELYAAKFPKKCNTCGRVYADRRAYLEATEGIARGTLFEDIIVQECRNCICGSTLAILTSDRRDDSNFGRVRRELFDACVEKLAEVTGQPREELVMQMRKLFRDIIHRAIKNPETLANSAATEAKAAKPTPAATGAKAATADASKPSTKVAPLAKKSS